MAIPSPRPRLGTDIQPKHHNPDPLVRAGPIVSQAFVVRGSGYTSTGTAKP